MNGFPGVSAYDYLNAKCGCATAAHFLLPNGQQARQRGDGPFRTTVDIQCCNMRSLRVPEGAMDALTWFITFLYVMSQEIEDITRRQQSRLYREITCAFSLDSYTEPQCRHMFRLDHASIVPTTTELHCD